MTTGWHINKSIPLWHLVAVMLVIASGFNYALNVNNKTASNNAKITNVEKVMNERTDIFHKRFDRMEKRFDSTDKKIDKMIYMLMKKEE